MRAYAVKVIFLFDCGGKLNVNVLFRAFKLCVFFEIALCVLLRGQRFIECDGDFFAVLVVIVDRFEARHSL